MNTGPTITLQFGEWEQIKILADNRMKTKNGHRFETILQTRCVYCRRGPHVRSRCGAWFQTFLSEIDTLLLNLDAERKAGHIK